MLKFGCSSTTIHFFILYLTVAIEARHDPLLPNINPTKTLIKRSLPQNHLLSKRQANPQSGLDRLGNLASQLEGLIRTAQGTLAKSGLQVNIDVEERYPPPPPEDFRGPGGFRGPPPPPHHRGPPGHWGGPPPPPPPHEGPGHRGPPPEFGGPPPGHRGPPPDHRGPPHGHRGPPPGSEGPGPGEQDSGGQNKEGTSTTEGFGQGNPGIVLGDGKTSGEPSNVVGYIDKNFPVILLDPENEIRR